MSTPDLILTLLAGWLLSGLFLAAALCVANKRAHAKRYRLEGFDPTARTGAMKCGGAPNDPPSTVKGRPQGGRAFATA